MKMTLFVSEVTYGVEFDIDTFNMILELDSRASSFEDTLAGRLEGGGARRVEYSGHFGPNVWFTCEQGDHHAHLTAIKKYLGVPSFSHSSM